MSPEECFFKYAFPCAFKLYNDGLISGEDMFSLERCALNGTAPSREKLESLFPLAIARLKASYGDNYWNIDCIHDYFVKAHNKILDEKNELPEPEKFACKVKICEVKRVGKDSLTVLYEGKSFNVKKLLVPGVKPGDLITVHLDFAIEKL